MSDHDNGGVGPSDKPLPEDGGNQSGLSRDQIVEYVAKLKKIREEIEELKKDKTPYGVIMNSPVIFVCGLFIGVLIMGTLLCVERLERKELKQELIEYVDKMVIKARTSE